jgi:hypothetical protein
VTFFIFLLNVLCIADCLENLGLVYGLGTHQLEHPVVDDNHHAETNDFFRKNVYISMILWIVGSFAVKVGLLISYHRTFDNLRTFRFITAIAGLFTLAVLMANLFTMMMRCSPSGKRLRLGVAEECFDANDIYITTWLLDVVGSVVVLVLPLVVLLKTKNMSLCYRLGLFSLYLIGAL